MLGLRSPGYNLTRVDKHVEDRVRDSGRAELGVEAGQSLWALTVGRIAVLCL